MKPRPSKRSWSVDLNVCISRNNHQLSLLVLRFGKGMRIGWCQVRSEGFRGLGIARMGPPRAVTRNAWENCYEDEMLLLRRNLRGCMFLEMSHANRYCIPTPQSKSRYRCGSLLSIPNCTGSSNLQRIVPCSKPDHLPKYSLCGEVFQCLSTSKFH